LYKSLARAAWGDTDPIGSSMERVWGRDDAVDAKRMGFLSRPAGTRVIGVVGDTVTRFMRPQTAMIYMPMDSTIYGPLLVRASNPGAAAAPVQEALRALETQGLIISRTGMGNFVADLPIESLVAPLAKLLIEEKTALADIFELRGRAAEIGFGQR